MERPTYDVERFLLNAGHHRVAGVDEVGRGAWAGPVVVCAAVTDLSDPPEGLTDSKLLGEGRRVELAAAAEGWVTAFRYGSASPEEIDDLGMTEALHRAACRALEGLPDRPDVVILDGKHDYLGHPWPVRTEIKADMKCVTVAAASVLAKVYRDGLMDEIGKTHPEYDFSGNAGYPSPAHQAALAALGPTPHHRVSWSFMDDLPDWRHLRKFRDPLVSQGQTTLF